HQLWVFKSGQCRIGLGHEQGILLWQFGDEFGIYREVVILHVTGSASAPVARELLVQENRAALGDQLREVRLSPRRSIGIEATCRTPVVYESDLPVQQPVKGGAGSCEHERTQRALARCHYDRPVWEETLRCEQCCHLRQAVPLSRCIPMVCFHFSCNILQLGKCAVTGTSPVVN